VPRNTLTSVPNGYILKLTGTASVRAYSVPVLCTPSSTSSLGGRTKQASAHRLHLRLREKVVPVALDGVERNKSVLIAGWAMKAAMLLVRCTPMPVLRLVLRASV